MTSCSHILYTHAETYNEPSVLMKYMYVCMYAARLPHGVKAIRKHLQTVDNVPLLVSLYTDATPHKCTLIHTYIHTYIHTLSYSHSTATATATAMRSLPLRECVRM